MSPNKEFLEKYICEVCHFSILQEHPEEKLSSLYWKKCPTCGFSKIIEDKNKHSIIYGRTKEE
jgi:hypothetical protein